MFCGKIETKLSTCEAEKKELQSKLKYYELDNKYEVVATPQFKNKYYIKLRTTSYPNYEYVLGTYNQIEAPEEMRNPLYAPNYIADRRMVGAFIFDDSHYDYNRESFMQRRIGDAYYILKPTNTTILEDQIRDLQAIIAKQTQPIADMNGGRKYNRTRKNISRNSAYKNRIKSKYYRK